MNKTEIIIAAWLALIPILYLLDVRRYPFTNHKLRFIFRLLVGALIYIVLIHPDERYSLLERAMWIVFLPSSFSLIFDSLWGLRLRGSFFYLGTESWLDRFFGKYNLILVWMIKFGLTVISLSILMNYSRGGYL
jgi:hypothetical protein